MKDASTAPGDATKPEPPKGAGDSTGSTAPPTNQTAIPPHLKDDPDAVAASKELYLAQIRRQIAEAEAARTQAGLPAAPTIPEIKAPTDRSVAVGDGAGTAVATLAAARAMDAVGFELGSRIASSVIGSELPSEKPALHPIVEHYENPASRGERRVLEGRQREAQQRLSQAATVCVIDSPSLALATLAKLEIEGRLRAYASVFSESSRVGDDLQGRASDDLREPIKETLNQELRQGSARSVVATFAPAAKVLSAAAGFAGAIAKSGVELVSALQSRYALHARAVDLDRTALVTATIDRVLDASIKVCWPRFQPIDRSPLLQLLREATTHRDRFALAHRARTTVIAPRPPEAPERDGSDGQSGGAPGGTTDEPRQETDAQSDSGQQGPGVGATSQGQHGRDDAVTGTTHPLEVDGYRSHIVEPEPAGDEDQLVGTAGDLISGFDSFVQAIAEADDEGSSPLLEAALIEAALPPTETREKTFLLFLGLTASGADAMTGQGLIKGSSAAVVGFAQAYFVLTRPDGTILNAGTSTKHESISLKLETAALKFGGSD